MKRSLCIILLILIMLLAMTSCNQGSGSGEGSGEGDGTGSTDYGTATVYTQGMKVLVVPANGNKACSDFSYEFKDELEDYYYYYVLYYKNFSIEEMLGKTNMLTAAQFNKLMDWFLDAEEKKADADENGYVVITYEYKNDLFGGYGFCEYGQKPASEAKDAK